MVCVIGIAAIQHRNTSSNPIPAQEPARLGPRGSLYKDSEGRYIHLVTPSVCLLPLALILSLALPVAPTATRPSDDDSRAGTPNGHLFRAQEILSASLVTPTSSDAIEIVLPLMRGG